MPRLWLSLVCSCVAASLAVGQESTAKQRLLSEYNTAVELRTKGELQKATVPYEETIKLSEGILSDSAAAVLRNDLARLYLELQNFKLAESHCDAAFRLNWKAHGDGKPYSDDAEFDHPRFCACLDTLATIYFHSGRYDRVERLYRQSLAIRQRYFSETHSDIAESFLALARFHHAIGKSDQAEKEFNRALDIRESRYGRNRPSTADVLNALGMLKRDQALLCRDRGDLTQFDKLLTEAEQKFLRCRAIREGAFSVTEEFLYLPHLHVAERNLALIERDRGGPAGLYAARQRLSDSIARMETKLGKDHPDVLRYLDDLARVQLARGEVRDAEDINTRCLKQWESWVATHYTAIAEATRTHALVDLAKGKPHDASVYIDNYSRRLRLFLQRVLPNLAEAEQVDFLRTVHQDALHFALSLGFNHKDDPALVRHSAEWLLNGKAISHEALTERRRRAVDTSDPKIRQLDERLRDTNRERLALVRLREAKPTDAALQERARRLEELHEDLSRQLGQATGDTRNVNPWFKIEQLRDELADHTLFVEIVRFRHYAPKEKGKPPQADGFRYAAWVIPPSKRGDIQVIDLGPAEPLDADIKALAQRLDRADQDILHRKSRAEGIIRTPLQAVSQRILRPLEPLLANATHWLISPDSNVWLVPWAALPLKDDAYAIEKHRIRYHNSGRDLLVNPAPLADGTAVVLGDPDYDGDLRPSDPKANRPALARRPRQFNPLPGVAEELNVLVPSLKEYLSKAPLVRTRDQATKTAFKTLDKPRVLVLCTHGHIEPMEPNRLENPLLRCYLALHGANHFDPATGADGIVTGLDIVGTNLRGTDLVILSACQTGGGDVLNGEGVAGLRQAFQLAGARSVFASLWAVDDRRTASLMKKFWSNLAQGENRTNALRSAQLELMLELKKEFGYAHPYFWAPFTQTGK